MAAEIKAKGVEFTTEPTTIRPGVRICFIRGPQGISIELLERDKKYARPRGRARDAKYLRTMPADHAPGVIFS